MSQKGDKKKVIKSSSSSQKWEQDAELVAILGDLQALTGGQGAAFDFRKAKESKIVLQSLAQDDEEDEENDVDGSDEDDNGAEAMEWEEESVSASETEEPVEEEATEEKAIEETSTSKKRKEVETNVVEDGSTKKKTKSDEVDGPEAKEADPAQKSNKQLKKEKRLLERQQLQNDKTTDVNTPPQDATEAGSTWNFEVDYNDHFETPAVAYSDILPLLDQLCAQLKKSKADLVIYDPYYCMGQMKLYLSTLGYTNVINENRDFYKDIRSQKLPKYDILLTNPPYSGEHKIKLMQYLTSKTHANRPFALLLPLYTVTKSYWKDYVTYAAQNARHVYYILPPDYYEYRHPEGTGKDIPPFYSSWICGGLTKEQFASSLQGLRSNPRRAMPYTVGPTMKRLPFLMLTVVDSVEKVVGLGLVADKRPNPKQRQKMKQQKGL